MDSAIVTTMIGERNRYFFFKQHKYKNMELIKKMTDRLLNNEPKKRTVFVFFAVLFIIGISNIADYGRPIDESVENDILLSNIKEYGLVFGRAVQGQAFEGITRISNSIEMDHGVAGYYLFSPILIAWKENSVLVMSLWHLYTYVFWFLGVASLYDLTKRLFRNRLTPFAGVLMYYFSPRIYAEGHYNNKDIVFLTLVLIMLAFAVRMIKYLRTSDIFLFSISSGLLMNCKTMGIAIWGLTGIFMVFFVKIFVCGNTEAAYDNSRITSFGKKNSFKDTRGGVRINNAKDYLSGLVPAAVFSVAFFILLTPAMWKSPVEYLRYCVANTARFSRWDGSILFRGVEIHPAAGELPRTYVLQWIAMTTPVYVSVLFVCSIAIYIYNLIRDKSAGNAVYHKGRESERLLGREKGQFLSENRFFYTLCLLTFICPVAYAFIRADTLVFYNGWRHNYYLYAYIIICAVYTIDFVFESADNCRKEGRNIAWQATAIGTMSLCFVLTVINMLTHRSFEYVYYNPVAEMLTDTTGYEADYWNVSEIATIKEFSKKILKEKNSEQLELNRVGSSGHNVVDIAAKGYAKNGQDQIMGKIFGNARLLDGDSVSAEQKYFVFNVSVMIDKSELNDYTQVFATHKYGCDLCAIYIRNSDKSH